jgi:hypothetical protein
VPAAMVLITIGATVYAKPPSVSACAVESATGCVPGTAAEKKIRSPVTLVLHSGTTVMLAEVWPAGMTMVPGA